MKTRSTIQVQGLSILHCSKIKSQLKFDFALAIVLIVFSLTSCEKSPLNDSLLIGRWSIINDSTLLLNDVPNRTDSHSNYIGGLTDYFDFTSEGNLYVKEGTNLDTLAYTYGSNNRIKIIAFSYNGTRFPGGANIGTYIIVGQTGNTVSLVLSELTPDGKETRIINLKKYVYIY
jgi:hypothetical protein